jgi:hypothetical protein
MSGGAGKEASTLIPKRNWLECVAISGLFLLLCVAGAVWDFTSGLLYGGIDGIMLLAVCLVMAAIFALMLLLNFQQAGLIPSFGKKKVAASAGAAKAAAPNPGVAPVPPAKRTEPQPTAQAK